MRIKLSLIFCCLFIFSLTLYSSYSYSQNPPTYLGNKGCNCHKTESKDWQKSPHGKAFDSLFADKRSRNQNKTLNKLGIDYKKDYNEDEKCLKCHVVGYKQAGGYQDASSSENLQGVGCEMCHGAGSNYADIHEKKEATYTKAELKAAGELFPKNDPQVCLKCHDNKESKFNAEEDKQYKFDHADMVKVEKAWHKIWPLTYEHK
ncbi:MAG: cytochrome c family protein [Nitrospinae bacterium]|nr:cytochrome c family protein [Nitrospinota bacterium]